MATQKQCLHTCSPYNEKHTIAITKTTNEILSTMVTFFIGESSVYFPKFLD